MLKYTFKSVFYLQKFNYTKEKAKRSGLHRVAGLIRTSAIRSLRVSNRTSLPGNPPFAKTRGGLRIIQFQVYSNGAIIGPVKFSKRNSLNKPIPHVHEFGGLFRSRTGFKQYPVRSFMYHTLKRLQSRKQIGSQFRVAMARQFNS